MPTPIELCEVTPQVGDWGTAFQVLIEQKDPDDVEQECLTIPVVLLAGETVELIFDPPGGPSFVRAAQIITMDPALVQYLWERGDIRTHGRWRAQPHVIGPTRDFRGRAVDFNVRPNLDAPQVWKDPRAAAVDLYLPQVAVLQV